MVSLNQEINIIVKTMNKTQKLKSLIVLKDNFEVNDFLAIIKMKIRYGHRPYKRNPVKPGDWVIYDGLKCLISTVNYIREGFAEIFTTNGDLMHLYKLDNTYYINDLYVNISK